MSTSTALEPREWRRGALYLVAVAMMIVSIKGQVESLESRLGGFAYVLAIANDVGAIMALDALFSAPRKSSIRKWAWTVIGLAAGTGGALNMWHVSVDVAIGPDGKLHLPPLPKELAYVVGAEPIVVLLVLSHLIGLVIAARRDRDTSSTGTRPAGVASARPAGAGVHQRTSTSTSTHQAGAGGHQVTLVKLGTSGTTDRHQAHIVAPPAPAGLAPAAPPHAPAPPAARTVAAAATTRPVAVSRRALEAVPAERPEWLTDTQLDAVLHGIRAARAEGQRYGRSRVMEDHRLNDPKAKALLAYIRDHRLLEAAS